MKDGHEDKYCDEWMEQNINSLYYIHFTKSSALTLALHNETNVYP